MGINPVISRIFPAKLTKVLFKVILKVEAFKSSFEITSR